MTAVVDVAGAVAVTAMVTEMVVDTVNSIAVDAAAAIEAPAVIEVAIEETAETEEVSAATEEEEEVANDQMMLSWTLSPAQLDELLEKADKLSNGFRIKICKDESNGQTTPVRLIGSDDAKAKAKEMVEDLLAEEER